MIRRSIRCLVAGQSGEGRVLAFAGDSTWRWQMERIRRGASAILAAMRAVAGEER